MYLHPLTPRNHFLKYADDVFLIIPSTNSASFSVDVQRLSSWAFTNNLCFNPSKTHEIIIVIKGSRRPVDPYPLLPNVERVTSMLSLE